MSKIKRIVVHCSDSEFGTGVMIDQWHRARGWSGIGYHAVIENGFPTNDHYRRGLRLRLFNGMLSHGRAYDADEELTGAEIGAHAYGHNKDTLAVCLIGKKNFTKQQVVALVKVVRLWGFLFKLYITDLNIGEIVVGHGELPGVTKTCPNIDMSTIRTLVLNKLEAYKEMRRFEDVKEGSYARDHKVPDG